MNDLPPEFKGRVYAKIDRRGQDECWPWTAGKSTDGYGRLGCRATGRKYAATRLVWFYEKGEIPDGYICHRCDNPSCCNPAHLFVGSAKENIADSIAKRRHFHQRKTACLRGHAFTPENTYFYAGRPKTRHCRTCRRESQVRAKKKGANNG